MSDSIIPNIGFLSSAKIASGELAWKYEVPQTLAVICGFAPSKFFVGMGGTLSTRDAFFYGNKGLISAYYDGSTLYEYYGFDLDTGGNYMGLDVRKSTNRVLITSDGFTIDNPIYAPIIGTFTPMVWVAWVDA